MAGFQPVLERAARQGGRPIVLNVNSFGGRIPLRGMSAYTASKFALAGFSEAIKPELADLGIHVAQVHPGAQALSQPILACAVRLALSALCCYIGLAWLVPLDRPDTGNGQTIPLQFLRGAECVRVNGPVDSSCIPR
jgi:NAD(P)-dependent dehydrogenase (short-subunit alcohol dehydrogenase family)